MYAWKLTVLRPSGICPGSISTIQPLGVLIELAPVASLSSRNAVRSENCAMGA